MKLPRRFRQLDKLADAARLRKTQLIRLADVFLIGPLMIYAGTRNKFSSWIDAALTVTGILTISYNADNYIRNRSLTP